jgi:hypothetical protein
MLNALYNKLRRPNRQSGDRVLSIAQRGVKRPETLTADEIKSLAASVISQARV